MSFKARNLIWIVIATFPACRATQETAEEDWHVDFSLANHMEKDDDTNDVYFDRLKKADESIQVRSSLPVPIKVGKAPDRFDRVPLEAQKATPGVVHLMDGQCQMRIMTGIVEFDRFIYAGKWIKLTDSLPPNVPVKIEEKQDLFLRATTIVKLDVDQRNLVTCATKFKGRTVFMGMYNIDKTYMGLVADPRSPPMKFAGKTRPEGGKKVFLRWGRTEKAPMLLDEFDMPLILESAIFHTKFDRPGYYYVTVRPALQKTRAAR